MKHYHVIGIDLGTTNTVVAIYDENGQPKVLPNLDGELKTPSVVHFGDGEILVGTAAYNMQMVEPDRTFIEFKRDVGTGKVYRQIKGGEITPELCQVELLRYQRQSVIRQFGDELAGSKAVITVPAYYGEKERQSVKHSAAAAGIDVIALINEPTAAGLAFGVTTKPGDRLILILDLGGGTFDVTLVQYAGGNATVLASDGDKRLGGKDVDEILMNLVADEFRQKHSIDLSSHPCEWFTVREEVLRQKHLLSARTEVKIASRVDGKPVIIPVTRERLAELIRPLLDSIEKLVTNTVQNAKVDPKDLDHILLVGGSSRLVAYESLLVDLFGKDRILLGQVSPDLAIAEGAAIHAAKLIASSGDTLIGESLRAIPAPAISHTDVMPHSLGVSVQDKASASRFCSVLLEKNTPIPCGITKRFGSVDDLQTRFKVSVLQGEDGQRVEDCLVVGERELELPARKPTEPSIECSMGYDASGLVKVTIKDMVSGRVEDITVNYYGRN